MFLILYHDTEQNQPYMLRGKRPDRVGRVKSLGLRKFKHKLSTLTSKQQQPRLGHRVGDKLGRKLSAVVEENEEY